MPSRVVAYCAEWLASLWGSLFRAPECYRLLEKAQADSNSPSNSRRSRTQPCTVPLTHRSFAAGRPISQRPGTCEFSLLLGAGEPQNRADQRSLQCPHQRHHRGGQHRLHRLRPHRHLHRREPRLCQPRRCPHARPGALSFFWHKLPTHRGFFYHFANINTGERIWDSEVSSVDTAMLLCGVLTCRQHFHDKDISDLAHAIFDRVDWTWLSEDTTLLSHGWTPELGFIPSRWDFYSELMMMYLLGLGIPSHPLIATHGLRGSGPSSNTMACATSVHLRRFLCTSIRRPGSIFAASETVIPTTLRIRPSRPMCTGAFASN